MKLLITGASGFVGKYVVAEGLRRGHDVKAVVRPQTDVTRIPWHDCDRLELVRIDLRQQAELTAALVGVDAVIHLAAVKSGDFYDQFAGTVMATESLLAAMAEAKVSRLVAISTFSVYEYQQKRAHSLLDENSPLVTKERVINRDEYSQTKLIQEELYREFGTEHNGKVTILRPGMIYGREYLWHALLGAEFGSVLLRIGTRGTLPLSYVENCAEAMIITAESEGAIGETINIVDDNLPTQGQYTKELMKRAESPKLYYCPWVVMKSIAGFGWWINQTFLEGKAKMPGIVVPAKLHGRFKPLRYTNKHAKTVLNWQPKYTFEESLDRSCGDQELLKA
ncbi:NAD(P)-dependent oxidoreductase [Spirulina major CS-329]|uniref:NAD-dependent epimerase/dehydratase family protein n=1 Tax=Spirulina TaxID=1154 RepID=UPI00232AA98B|nr:MULTISPECIES: NAD(P)-dependent oxidoreductase [Spirulina]MDB9494932.1 NAD(P)-dependent oxidoreductase [Spirulina subsalsa CS-330]MDB9504159.1 NAD(P)-dependent oxidoreductase [Spirulina major CS-329]